jgi:hypothetical protein
LSPIVANAHRARCLLGTSAACRSTGDEKEIAYARLKAEQRQQGRKPSALKRVQSADLFPAIFLWNRFSCPAGRASATRAWRHVSPVRIDPSAVP